MRVVDYDHHTMKSSRHLKRWFAAALLATAVVVVPTGALPVTPVHAEGLGAGGEYHPLTPARIFDSRPGLAINDVEPAGAKAIGSTFDLQLLGQGGVPADGAGVLAVVVNVTVRAIDPAELAARCQEKLASFKVPRAFKTVDSLPRNAMGKIQKHLLRQS